MSKLLNARSEKCNILALSVDREKRTIKATSVIQAGPLRDSRSMIVDQETNEQVVALGNAAADGIKVRWTHPEFESDHLGKYLGRAKNFRIDGDTVRADIYFCDAASISPVFERDPIDYLTSLADEDPKAFALSIYFDPDREAMEKISSELDAETPTPIRLKTLIAIDFVDEGAASHGLLGRRHIPGDLVGCGILSGEELRAIQKTLVDDQSLPLACHTAKWLRINHNAPKTVILAAARADLTIQKLLAGGRFETYGAACVETFQRHPDIHDALYPTPGKMRLGGC